MIKKLLFYFIVITTTLFSKETIKVGYPLEFTDMYLYKNLETSEYNGVYVDILKGYIEGKNIELQYKIANGKEDIIIGERADNDSLYNIINTPFSYRATVLVNVDSPLKKIDDIFAMNVGYVKGERGIEEVANRNKDLEFEKISYENENKTILALKNNRVDAIVLKDWSEKNPIEKKFRVLSTTIFKEKLRVTKDNVELYEDLKKYIAAMSTEEIREIVEKNRIEYYKYLLKNTPSYESVKENYKSIKVELMKDEYYLPLYYKEEKNYRGLIFDILEDINKILEIPIEVVESDGDIKGIYVEKERENRYVATKPYYKTDIAVASKGHSFLISDFSDLDNSKIIMVRSRSFRKLIEDKTYGVTIVDVETVKEGIEKLLKDEGDYLIDYSNPLTSTILNNFIDNKVKIIGNFSENFGISMGVKESEEDLKSVLDTIFNSYSIEEITVGANKNTQIVFKRDYKLLAEITIPMIVLIGILSYLLRRAIYNKRKAEKLGNTLLETMAKVNQLKQTESGVHAKRVALHAEFLAEKLNLSKEFTLKLKKGAILHDIGKVIVPGDILNKKGKLTPEEFEIMKKHPEFGYELACKLGIGDIEKNVIRYHHEKWCGKGYPLGLKEESIPLEGRILGISDAYDSMREDKIYKKGLSHEEAIEIIKSEMGVSFDPNITKIFLENEAKFNEIFNGTKENIDLVSEYYSIMKNQ